MVINWLCAGFRPSTKHRSRLLHCKILLLDEHEMQHDISSSDLGLELLNRVFHDLNILEINYFGLRYLDEANQTRWLNPNEKIGKQINSKKGELNLDICNFYFGVKFYTPDPCRLLKETTRYQFFLQIKQDILQGRLLVSLDLAAELGAYVVQSELGDYDKRRHCNGYVKEFRFLSNQTPELEARIADLHKSLIGQLPSAAELNYLDKVKRLELYGVDLHPVLGDDNVEYFLGLSTRGIILLRNKIKVGCYCWPRINKIYHKGKYFMLRVNEKNSVDRTHGFETPSRNACRHLFQCCVDLQAFFQLAMNERSTLYRHFTPDNPILKTEKRFGLQCIYKSKHFSERAPYNRVPDNASKGQNIPNNNNENLTVTIYNSENVKSFSNFKENHAKHSPKSFRSAPWSQNQPRGLYNSSSPRSVRSTGTVPTFFNRLHQRSSSVGSQSSADSHVRGYRRRSHRRTPSRSRHSDCDSQVSRSSTQRSGHRKHRRKHNSSRISRRPDMDFSLQWRKAHQQETEIIHQAIISQTEPRRKHKSRSRSLSTKYLSEDLQK